MGRLMVPREGDSRVRGCARALWSSKGEDLSESSPRGLRLNWMRQQADRMDPLVESPSVLDRRHEIRRW
jgi:hypothetical protein